MQVWYRRSSGNRPARSRSCPALGALLALATGCAAAVALSPHAAAASNQWQTLYKAYQTTPAVSESVGAPNRGRLRSGLQLPRTGPGFVRRARGNQYGTYETIALVRFAAARLAEAFPGTAPLLIGDISKRGGGSLSPHRSHQSGRDADIAFPERSGARRNSFNPHLGVADVDLEKTWFVLETLITTGRVQYVFVDRRLLAPLRREAGAVGWSEEALARLFGRGPIRQAPGHMSHFHVRFHCPVGDSACSD